MLENTKANPNDYKPLQNTPRPGHADYTAALKYHGFSDYRGGGHFSGRLTAPLVAVGAIIEEALTCKGIRLASHIAECHGIKDAELAENTESVLALQKADFPTVCPQKGEEMKAAIRQAKAEKNSIGGIVETVVTGMPGGVGEPWFDTVEGMLSHALFSIPAIKGVSFGDGFAFADLMGSESNDAFAYENGKIVTVSNHNGGINGGITNGMRIRFRCAVKPTPSIGSPQQTVDLKTGEAVTLAVEGRHDACLLPRICPVVDAVTALVLADLLTTRYGTDWLSEEQ